MKANNQPKDFGPPSNLTEFTNFYRKKATETKNSHSYSDQFTSLYSDFLFALPETNAIWETKTKSCMAAVPKMLPIF